MKRYLLFFIVLLTAGLSASAQDIASHQWKDRVLIILTTVDSDESFQKQLQILQQEKSGLEERKLKVYLTTPLAYKKLSSIDENWITGGTLYNTHKSKESTLELILIGLDGGVKYRTYKLTPALEIFTVIDGMPMPRSEINNNKQGSQ